MHCFYFLYENYNDNMMLIEYKNNYKSRVYNRNIKYINLETSIRHTLSKTF